MPKVCCFVLIFFRKDHKKCEFEIHEVYGVDILISTGDGKAKEREARTTVFKRTDLQYGLKMKASRRKIFFEYLFGAAISPVHL